MVEHALQQRLQAAFVAKAAGEAKQVALGLLRMEPLLCLGQIGSVHMV